MAITIGGFWLVAWLSGVAAHWSAAGMLIMKSNMALGQILAGTALLVLGLPGPSLGCRRTGIMAASVVLLIGGLTLSEHLFGYNLGIDQLLARESPGAAATTSPNQMGVPGATSLLLLGTGLLGLAWRGRFAAYLGVAVCFINLVPLVGFLYAVEQFYGQPQGLNLGIAWPSVVALICLGAGLAGAQTESGPMVLLRRNDAGGMLLRRLVPAVVLVPLILGFLRVRGQGWGFYDTSGGTGLLMLALIVIFMGLLWHSALRLSQSASAQATAEAELRQSQERQQLAIELGGMATWDVELRTGKARWSPNHFTLLGYPAAPDGEATYEMWRSRVHSEDLARVEQGFAEARRTRTSYAPEHRVLRADNGEARWLSAAGRFLYDEAGEAIRFVGVFFDITERKRSEAALHQAHQRLLYHTNNTPLAVIEFDTELRISAWSEQARRVFGWEAFEVFGKSMFEVPWLLPEDVPAIEKVAAGLRSGQTPRSVSPNRNVRKDGRVIWCEWYNSSLADPSSGMGSIQSLVLEVTERKRAEEAVRASEARLAQAVRVAALGTFEHDHRTDAIQYSSVMRQLMNFREDEEVTIAALVGKVMAEDRESLAAGIRQAHDPAGDGVFEADYRVAHRLGGVRWVSARSQTFFEGAGSERRPVRTTGVALDVTQRRQAQAELERLVAERTAKLQELVGEMEHFSYTITHDMRAPLRAMKGFGELATDLCSECVHDNRKEFVRRIMTAADRMDHLITDALDYSRSVRQELPIEEVDTGALLRGMLDSYPELQASKVRITIQGELPTVLGNEAGLTQCFSNLLGNGVKFVKPGETPEICVRADQRDGWARIWVEDKGIGISTEMLPRVFEMFSRGSKSYEGTGIGLALVRKAAQRMGGRVGVESEEGKGSRFWLELKASEMKKTPEATAKPLFASERGTVLYVEDEENDALFMKRAFVEKGLGAGLRTVGDGRAAMEYLSGAGKYTDRVEYPLPAVVLLDLNLPQVSGFEVLRWMRNHPDFAATPVVVFSSSKREDDKTKARELGANEFLEKPTSAMRFGDVAEELRRKWLG